MVDYRAISSSTSSGTSVTAGAPVGTVPGDLLIACVTVMPAAGQSSSGSWDGDWIFFEGASGGGVNEMFVALAIRTADGVSDSASFTLSDPCHSVLSVVGFSDAADFPTTAFTPHSGTPTTTVAAPSVTAPSAGILLCFAGGKPSSGATTWTPPSGMTEILDLQEATDWTTMSAAYQVISGSGATGAKTFTASNTQAATVSMSAFIEPTPPIIRARAVVSPTAVHRASRW